MLSDYRLVIFDKDGTLIDFDAMWGGWATELARRLGAACGQPVADALFQRLGFDPVSGRALPHGELAVASMARLRHLSVDTLRGMGFAPEAAEAAVAAAWHVPDPVALARPLADLRALFGGLRERGLKVAVATTDDRAPTEATLAALGVAPLVEAVVCADDGVPVKPAPDMVFALCRATGVAPAQSVVVGDTTADLRMGRAAGAGRVVGVLSGVSSAETLQPYADKVIASVAELIDNMA